MIKDLHRGWLIEQNWLNQWEATGPDFDASWEGEEDGWCGNGQSVTAMTRAGVIEEIDAWIEERDANVPAT
ncbi:MAG TPA: hypothetical protein VF637_05820 [Sphingomicrobium sp.]|jgi:hypothetical protein